MKNQRNLIQDLQYKYALKKLKECPFCDLKDHQILHEYKCWTLVRNKFPWKMWREHNLLILKEHLDNSEIDQLSDEELEELGEIRKKHEDFVFMHTAPLTNRVKHLHIHIVK